MKESPGPLRTFPELSGCPESALLHGSGLFLSFCHGGYRVAGVPLRCRRGRALCGGVPAWSLACPAFYLLSCPIPPTPLAERSSQREGGDYKFILPGAPPPAPRHPGTEPPTTLTDPSIQVPCGKLAFFAARVSAAPAKPQDSVSNKQCQCRARSAPGDARGEAFDLG